MGDHDHTGVMVPVDSTGSHTHSWEPLPLETPVVSTFEDLQKLAELAGIEINKAPERVTKPRFGKIGNRELDI